MQEDNNDANIKPIENANNTNINNNNSIKPISFNNVNANDNKNIKPISLNAKKKEEESSSEEESEEEDKNKKAAKNIQALNDNKNEAQTKKVDLNFESLGDMFGLPNTIPNETNDNKLNENAEIDTKNLLTL